MGAGTLAAAALVTALAGAGAQTYGTIQQGKAQKEAAAEQKKESTKQLNLANSQSPDQQQVVKKQALSKLARGGTFASALGTGGIGGTQPVQGKSNTLG